jgi:hypothetical protein
MSKNKMIGVAIWLLTVILPFKASFIDGMHPNMFTLAMFVLCLVGITAGAFFFSKKESTQA